MARKRYLFFDIDGTLFVEPSDKAFGIRKVMDHFGARYADAMVFGDAMNDITMFVDDWTCVAMGNAVPELKKHADYVTTAVDDDGIWNACEVLGLFESVEE